MKTLKKNSHIKTQFLVRFYLHYPKQWSYKRLRAVGWKQDVIELRAGTFKLQMGRFAYINLPSKGFFKVVQKVTK